MRIELAAAIALSLLTIASIPFFATQARADLIPIYNGSPFGTLLNPTLDPNYFADAPAAPVLDPPALPSAAVTDNPVVAVYDSTANVTWMSDQFLFQEQYFANNYFLSTLVGQEVIIPDGSQRLVTADDFWYNTHTIRSGCIDIRCCRMDSES